MSIVLVGSTSGSITLQEPAVAGTTVLDLPATSGTILTTTSPKAGNVIQVVRQTITTQASYTLNGGAIQATALTASITPTSSSSHIVVQMMAALNSNAAGQGLYGEIRRGTSTTLNPSAGGGSQNYPIHWLNTQGLPNIGSGGNQMTSQTWLAFDSPATTSSTSYTFYIYGVSGAGPALLNAFNTGTASSVVLLWEIAG